MKFKKALCAFLLSGMVLTASACAAAQPAASQTNTASSSEAVTSSTPSPAPQESSQTVSSSEPELLPSSNASSLAASSGPLSSDLDSIKKKLSGDKTIPQFEVSHSSKLIALIRQKTDDGMSLSFSVLNVLTGEETPIKDVDIGNLYDPKWSFDDKYLSVSEGTAHHHSTYILNTSNWNVKTTIGHIDAMAWAPDSEYAAFAIENEIKQVIETEVGSTDLVLYNLDSLKSKKLLKGTANIDYRVMDWDKSGLHLYKSTVIPEKSNKITVKPDTKF